MNKYSNTLYVKRKSLNTKNNEVRTNLNLWVASHSIIELKPRIAIANNNYKLSFPEKITSARKMFFEVISTLKNKNLSKSFFKHIEACYGFNEAAESLEAKTTLNIVFPLYCILLEEDQILQKDATKFLVKNIQENLVPLDLIIKNVEPNCTIEKQKVQSKQKSIPENCANKNALIEILYTIYNAAVKTEQSWILTALLSFERSPEEIQSKAAQDLKAANKEKECARENDGHKSGDVLNASKKIRKQSEVIRATQSIIDQRKHANSFLRKCETFAIGTFNLSLWLLILFGLGRLVNSILKKH